MGFKLLLALAEILFIGCSMSCNVLCDVFSCLLQNLGSYKRRNILLTVLTPLFQYLFTC